jgi:hypothetical protein
LLPAIQPVPYESFLIPKHPSDWTTANEDEEGFSDNRHRAAIRIACQDPEFFSTNVNDASS